MILALSLSFLGGACLSSLYVFSLWRNVRAVPEKMHKGRHLARGVILRMIFVLAGIWGVSGGDTYGILAALGGFMLTRIIIVGLMSEEKASEAPVGDSV